MNCPGCNHRETEVLETRRAWTGTDVRRRHRCGKCGARWESMQRLIKDTFTIRGASATTGSPPVGYGQTTGQLPDGPPTTTGSPPVVDGGVGGGLSPDPVRALSVPDPAGSLSAKSPRKVKVMGPPAYVPDFERLWSGTDKLGSKSDAFRAWEYVGRPDPDAIVASRRAWLDHWAGIGVKHIATWLRAYDWQQEPAPRQQALVPRADPGPRQSKNGAVVAAVLAMNAGGKT